ncbi:MAG: GntR family transcriptional regulator [Acidobacteriaceae bacterium]|nr:GntR family transcriptional regulator [Acidobacteriaceae bacterium]MBV9780912.1 GntR family transcriptional regulator [Acidobacteriaceae bacterium]
MMQNRLTYRMGTHRANRATSFASPKMPAYKAIQVAVQQMIDTDGLRPGDNLPSERELAKSHSVSLMTARAALTGLERQGLVERRPGSGTFVAVPKINYNKLMSTTELMGARGLQAASRVLSSRIIEGFSEVTAPLGLPDRAPLVKLRRLRLVQKQRLALETSYLPAEHFKSIIDAPLKNGSLFNTLEERFGVQLAYADEEVDAIAADTRVATHLQILSGSAVLRIRQVIYSTSGLPVLYVVGLYRGDRHRLLIRRARP